MPTETTTDANNEPVPALLVGRTTTATRTDAERIAGELVRLRLAACAQVDGPIKSHYIWDGKFCADEEFGVTIKFLPEKLSVIEKRIHEIHPYKTPQWIVVPAIAVSEKYLAWAKAQSTPASA